MIVHILSVNRLCSFFLFLVLRSILGYQILFCFISGYSARTLTVVFSFFILAFTDFFIFLSRFPFFFFCDSLPSRVFHISPLGSLIGERAVMVETDRSIVC